MSKNFWDNDAVVGESDGKFWINDPPPDASKEWKAVGSKMSTPAKAFLSAIQGPTFGFGDEIAGGLGAVASRVGGTGSDMPFGEAYRAMRDIARGAQESYEQQNPTLATGAQIAASLPYAGPIKGVQAMLPAKAGPMARAVAGGVAGGALGGAGASQNTGTILTDTLQGAVFGGVGGGVIQGASPLVKGIAENVVSRMAANPNNIPVLGQYAAKTADDLAYRRVLEALQQDQKTAQQASARLGKLGDRAVLADTAGANTRGLLDTVATMPGQSKDLVERLIHQRQAGRAGALTEAASQSLGAGNRRLGATLEGLDNLRSQQAIPLYQKLQGVTLTVDPELQSILQRAAPAFSQAKKIAGLQGKKFDLNGDLNEVVDTLTNARTIKSVPLEQLDTLKRSLYDMEQANINPETLKLNQLGNVIKDLRRDLVAKMDAATIDPKTGQSIYAQARAAYAGPSELRAAANLGSQAMSKDAAKLADIMRDMSESELEAFRIGAFESLRKKFGTESGQTQILKMWKEPATREKLQELFGDERSFREFASTVAAEGRLKALESVGRGSQTASRQAGQDDLAGKTLSAAADLKTGNVFGVVDRVRNLYGRAATPEPVRNRIGSILLSNSDNAPSELARLGLLSDALARQQTSVDRNPVVITGLLGRMLTQ